MLGSVDVQFAVCTVCKLCIAMHTESWASISSFQVPDHHCNYGWSSLQWLDQRTDRVLLRPEGRQSGFYRATVIIIISIHISLKSPSSSSIFRLQWPPLCPFKTWWQLEWILRQLHCHRHHHSSNHYHHHQEISDHHDHHHHHHHDYHHDHHHDDDDHHHDLSDLTVSF